VSLRVLRGFVVRFSVLLCAFAVRFTGSEVYA
jgi:hypothetical protein